MGGKDVREVVVSSLREGDANRVKSREATGLRVPKYEIREADHCQFAKTGRQRAVVAGEMRILRGTWPSGSLVKTSMSAEGLRNKNLFVDGSLVKKICR